ncbi:MAG: type II 3-dehydroquinate dehydratase [Clostridia bacterium]|nr:type II 3-dehydroquinate dehydratase [Clostridia bacterium]
MKFLIINGPNLNMLGLREPGIYGDRSYTTLCQLCEDWCAEEGIECELFQSNHEGVIVDKIQEAYGKVDGIIINPAAYTHTSVAILDALKAVAIPTMEVHISKVSEREAFRQISFVSYYAVKTIQGMGFEGYREAIRALKKWLQS